jgi:hypothetical protein
MHRRYVLVEGEIDRMILDWILPKDLKGRIQLVVTQGGYNAGLSIAKSLLITRPSPISIVMNADSTSRQSIEERYDFIEQTLRMVASPERFSVYLFEPDIEHIFLLPEHHLLENMLTRELPHDMVMEIRQQPQLLKQVWKMNVHGSAILHSPEGKLFVEHLRQTGPIQQLLEAMQCEVPELLI